jgi:chromosome segregation ATPase
MTKDNAAEARRLAEDDRRLWKGPIGTPHSNFGAHLEWRDEVCTQLVADAEEIETLTVAVETARGQFRYATKALADCDDKRIAAESQIAELRKALEDIDHEAKDNDVDLENAEVQRVLNRICTIVHNAMSPEALSAAPASQSVEAPEMCWHTEGLPQKEIAEAGMDGTEELRQTAERMKLKSGWRSGNSGRGDK